MNLKNNNFNSIFIAVLSLLAVPTAIAQVELKEVLVSAEEQAKQALGASHISQQDLAISPVINDLAKIIRTQPGVNLTGNSTSGQRGNNRQIDIRGMGPENTLILIDGRPVNSRNAVRYGWRGERDSRGDTNWVPAEMVESIEVLRGPAAARYGNGAAGGVVNIITKKPTDKFSGQVTTFFSKPQHSEEGGTKRLNFNLMGPIADNLSFRVYGNYNHTDADAWDINLNHQSERTGGNAKSFVAGREGVKNGDINGLVKFDINPQHSLELELGYSQQKNIFAGDSQNTNSINPEIGKPNPPAKPGQKSPIPYEYNNLGDTTNTMTRTNFALTHNGDWGRFTTKSYLQYEATNNKRLGEGLMGGLEGKFQPDPKTKQLEFKTAKLTNYNFHTEAIIPFETIFDQVVTTGFDWSSYKLDDPSGINQSTLVPLAVKGDRVPFKFDAPIQAQRNSTDSSNLFSIFFEDNIDFKQGTVLTAALRLDKHSKAGTNLSPSLNLWHEFNANWTFKTGIAQAYKAPNIYQSNPNYLLYSMGQGCWKNNRQPCFLQGNENLKAETSINSELGIEFKNEQILANFTYFNNQYKNKIEAGLNSSAKINGVAQGKFAGKVADVQADWYQWDNIPKSVVSGIEGSLNIKFAEYWNLNNNLTYMISSKNKKTDEELSIIPKYTFNSTLSWQVNPQVMLVGSATFYGKQKPKKFNYNGGEVKDEDTNVRKGYALFGVNAQYQITPNIKLFGGIDNLFDKRLYREGNAQGVVGIKGAGANTYNEAGRTFFLGITGSF